MKGFILAACCGLSLYCLGQPDAQKKLQRLFVDAESYSTITLPEGTFTLDVSLWLDGQKHVVIRGAGMDKTVLDFAGQVSGAEGIRVTNASQITIQDLTVLNTRGDGIKAQQVDTIQFSRVKVGWTRGPHKDNGGYGLYPVQCSQVLIDSCQATGASDAGIYVGQSRNIIVRNCRAWENVAGIEIENSAYADVYRNEAWNNTGGLLIFDLPDLAVKQGGYTRAFENDIHDNNLPNFAPKGNIVAKVPQGTGVMILATNHVELFHNRIRNNISLGTAILSYYMTEHPIKDSAYYPYPGQIAIHHNQYERPHVRATSKGRMGKMFRFKLRFGKDVPHILYDGIADPEKPANICIQDNTGQTFANIRAADDFKGISRDDSSYRCTLPALKGL